MATRKKAKAKRKRVSKKKKTKQRAGKRKSARKKTTRKKKKKKKAKKRKTARRTRKKTPIVTRVPPPITNIPQEQVGEIVQSFLDLDDVRELELFPDGEDTFSVRPQA